MTNPINVLTITGSPHDAKSNTRGYVEDFIDDVAAHGVELHHTVISLGRKDVRPCRGCWNCTVEKPCPVKDDLPEIKKAMVDCDMLILASPVYTNQVTAQMKAMVDRLFTWCHIFPLLGKFGMTAVTTGNDGGPETSGFLEKILATYGIRSFGTIVGTGAFTPGFYPRRQSERARNTRLAARVAEALKNNRQPKPTAWNRKMFSVMSRKMSGVNLVRHMNGTQAPGSPTPPRSLERLVKKGMAKRGVSDADVARIASLMSFEYRWWQDRKWLGSRSFSQLMNQPVPEDFDIRERLA